MISSGVLESLFKTVQGSCSPALWSQGVTLTRGGNSFVSPKQTDDETVVHVRLAGQVVSPKVTLWPEGEDWDCDCGSPQSPCAHVVAAVIVLKRGVLAAPEPGDEKPAASAADAAQLHYEFRRSPEGLRFERHLVHAGARRKLDMPLLNYVGGRQSGRVSGPDVLATKADYSVDQALFGYHGTALDRKRLEALFKAFDPDQAVFLDGKKAQIATDVIQARFECVDEGAGYRVRRIKNPSVTEIFPHGVALCSDTLKLMAPLNLTAEEKTWVAGDGSYWSPEQEKRLCADVLPALRKKVPIEIASLKLPQTLELPPRLRLELDKATTARGEACLSVLANIVYGDPPLVQLNPQTLQLVPVRDRLTSRMHQVVRRNPEAERALVQKLARELDLQVGRRVEFTGATASDFTYRVRGWEFVGDGYAAFNPEGRALAADVRVSEGDGVSFDVKFLSPGGSSESAADFPTVFKAWQAGQDRVPLLDGSWAEVPKDWLAKHGKRIRDFLAATEARRPLPAHRLPELAALCADIGVSAPESVSRLKTLVEDFRGIEKSPLPSDLTATLRDYQKRGVDWLSFLRNAGLGALLADDMGLGKTLQTLCAIRGRTLIVAPTSVLFNWGREIEKFRPALKASHYYGPGRKLDLAADVTITSYGLLRLDQETLTAQDWDTVVLDEAQTIKNPESQIAKVAHRIRAGFRVALSGTPVENRLDDLWSQFHFLNPGLLGGREDFLENYARPIGRGETQVASRLRQRVKPFLLRRLKKEVAAELPPRTETVLHCELTPDERSTYEAILSSTKSEALAALEGGGSILKALEVILRLRQACCHGALVPGVKAETSSKTELLLGTLEESIEEGHKSLVFSQWTSYLDLISERLKAKNIRHSRIDGSTADRRSVVEEFQGSGGPPVMLISLKAGGVGLTLTAADHVFIVDPWWNPAVEDQAADRAHRIGQQNPVMIHRLVARESIEERILALQEKKKDLARAVLEEGGAALSLTRADILDLLG
jgi:superfamily II DNA or RNA helicase